jgi:hypothetical protein
MKPIKISHYTVSETQDPPPKHERTFYHSFPDEEALLDALTKVGITPAVCLPDKRDRCELRNVSGFADVQLCARGDMVKCFRDCKKVKIIAEGL